MVDRSAYYRMQFVAGEADNPDQRVAEDVPQFIARTLNLSIGGMRAVVTFKTPASGYAAV